MKKKSHKRRMPDDRLSIQVKASRKRPQDIELVKAFKAELAAMHVEESPVMLDLVAAYLDCVKREKVLPRPPFVLESAPR